MPPADEPMFYVGWTTPARRRECVLSHKILLIGGDAACIRMVSESLGTAGYVVEHSGAGYEALDAFLRDRPDVALLPIADGQAEVCRQLKQTEVGRQTPILLFSERDLSE